mmetsp:Transcript_30441/g.90200  ORF Transcript_30441/g.90200 Transcript_30441/m.90200 type:complete len:242 (+) Transcript_30441:84-809(+)
MPPSMTLLQLEPDTTLHFSRAPNTTSPSRVLKLTNLHSTPVAFKVKTTAPKAYLVRPSAGTLRPREPQEVQIILQPQGVEPAANNHRFLVQAIAVSSAEPVSREQWGEFPKEKVQEQRLNVVLEEVQAEPAAATKPSEAIVGNTIAPGASAVSAASAPKDAMMGMASAGDRGQPGDLKVKYEELVQYTLMLEKEKNKLEADMASLQAAKGTSVGEGSYSKIQVLMVAVFAFLLSYVAKFLG